MAFREDSIGSTPTAAFFRLSAIGALLAVGCTKPATAGIETSMLQPGDLAPHVSAVDQNGTVHKLSDKKGHPVVVYFYPADATPGCTKEACAFRDTWNRFSSAGISVFGVSTDNRVSHEKFAREERLPFPLLADPDHVWTKAFGVSTKQGRASRVSFLIDRNGKIAKTYPRVDPGVHADEVLGDATSLP